MPKKSYLILSLLLTAIGCTREIYLQAVPCTEGNCEQEAIVEPAKPVDCPELMMQTETLTYRIVDVPTPKTTYVSHCDDTKRNCKTVCRLQKKQ